MNNIISFNRNFLVKQKKVYRQKGKTYIKGSLSEKRKILQDLSFIKKYIVYKYKEKLYNSYNPALNNKKLLLLVATHTNSELKLNNIQNTLNYLDFNCMDVMVANTTSLQYNEKLSEYYKSKNIEYYEIENDGACDFGKWIYLLSQVNYSTYDYVFFINDSFIIQKPITHFVNLAIRSNAELYGYNDSTQDNYHYQSYLFAIKSDAISKFIHMFNSKNKLIKSQRDVIELFELKMLNHFSSSNCFLKIGNTYLNKGLNIFFTNDFLYNLLKKSTLLPFIKIKRIT